MKNIWHYTQIGDKLVKQVWDKKVIHVVQDKKNAKIGYCYWTGELDDEKYFMIQVLDGVVILTVGECEGELKTKERVSVAYIDKIKHIVEETNELYKLQDLLVARETFIPEFMDKLTFEDIMEIFMWKYASPNVEVYEYLL